MRAVLLPLGVDVYALPVETVRQVVASPSVTRLVTAPAVVRGLLNLRGEIVPVLDLGILLGTGPVEATPYAVVINTAHGAAGLAATGVPQHAELDPPVGSSELPGTAGTCVLDGRVVVLLDPTVLLGTSLAESSQRPAVS
jgi:purine-binding chemotaxis protein CheW